MDLLELLVWVIVRVWVEPRPGDAAAPEDDPAAVA